MDDNAILDLFRERSEDAIVQVQIKYGNYCRSIAYGILSSEEDSEECVLSLIHIYRRASYHGEERSGIRMRI